MPRVNVKRAILSEQEVLDMIEASKNDLELRALISFLYLTGARISEAIGLKKKHFKLEINAKGVVVGVVADMESLKHREIKTIEYRRELWLSGLDSNGKQDFFVDLIVRWLENINGPEDLVWRHRRETYWKRIKKIDPSVTLHLFRHTRASIFGKKGYTSFQLCHWFGWAKQDTAGIYVKMDKKVLREMGNNLGVDNG